MEECVRNNGIFRADSNKMRVMDGKQEIYLEWPNPMLKSFACVSSMLATVVQVFAIESIAFAIDFVPFAVEFVTFAVEFIPFVIEFVSFALEFVTFAQEFVPNKSGSCSKHENNM